MSCDKRLVELSVTSMVAGIKYRGEFEVASSRRIRRPRARAQKPTAKCQQPRATIQLPATC